MRKLDLLIKNANSIDADHIQAYCLGFPGTYDPRKVPGWMNEYRIPPHPLYNFCVPWNDETAGILVRIESQVDDRVLKSNARWGLEAWREWQLDKEEPEGGTGMNDYIDSLGVTHIDACVDGGATPDDDEDWTEDMIATNLRVGVEAVAAKVLTDLIQTYSHSEVMNEVVHEWAKERGIELQPTSPVDKV